MSDAEFYDIKTPEGCGCVLGLAFILAVIIYCQVAGTCGKNSKRHSPATSQPSAVTDSRR